MQFVAVLNSDEGPMLTGSSPNMLPVITINAMLSVKNTQNRTRGVDIMKTWSFVYTQLFLSTASMYRMSLISTLWVAQQLTPKGNYVTVPVRVGRKFMYEVKFYRDKSGESEIVKYLDTLGERGRTSKTARINHNKILAYMGALELHGTRVGEPVVKHIGGAIWELRPLKNRIFFFYWKDNKFVMLHHFIKKTKKTPPGEIERAKANMKNHIERFGE